MLNRRKFLYRSTAILSAVTLFQLTGCGKEDGEQTSMASNDKPKNETNNVIPQEKESVSEASTVKEELPATESTPPANADAARVAEDEPTAVALNYVHDASKATTRTINDATCKSCQFFTSDSDWGPCSIFTGREVSASGWCSAWSKKV